MTEKDHPIRPTAAELRAAEGRTIPDLIAPELKMLFVGINPGLYSGATGYHFAHPANRFWPGLHQAGITPRRLQPWEEVELLAAGYGITCMVARATVGAQELRPEEYRAGARRLEEVARTWNPGLFCFLGIGAYRTGFNRRGAAVGLQQESIEGVPVWVLPSPSGLNAHCPPAEFARLLREVAAHLVQANAQPLEAGEGGSPSQTAARTRIRGGRHVPPGPLAGP